MAVVVRLTVVLPLTVLSRVPAVCVPAVCVPAVCVPAVCVPAVCVPAVCVPAVCVPAVCVVPQVADVGAAQQHLRQQSEDSDEQQCRTD